MLIYNLKSLAILFAITLNVGFLAGCSSRQSPGDQTSSPAAKPAASTAAAPEPAFKIGAAWKPLKVIIVTESYPGSPGMKYSITAKPDLKLVAIELILNRDDPAHPLSADFSEIAVVDSAGGRHKPLFTYPSAVTTYKPGGDSVSFADKPGQLTNAKLNELGGKLISVFEAPVAERAFEVSIGAAPPVHVELNAR
ncbi:MAG: hypothetical protein DMF61_17015 [Blastocatellia bacterium AA13]|nr:MAG: hypothetical protein DMF61_17015 [Blastocatellia bacterium AA13]